jgi:hypothetical protein
MRLIAACLLLCLPLGWTASAQANPTPARATAREAIAPEEAPDAATLKPALAVSPLRPVQPPHRFWDLRNSLAIGTFGFALAADSYSTQRGLAYPQVHEANPLARPFVASRGGQVAYSGAGFALFAGGMYLVHRTGHHKVERMAPWIAAGWEAALAGWNMHEVTLARQSR